MSPNATTLELPSDREILITRAFDGPARLVFEAWTRPELVERWWAPRSRGVTMASCAADVRAGGHYRYVLRIRTGSEVAFSGRYIEVSPPQRLVYTQIFEPTASGPADDGPGIVITVTFEEEEDGRTRVVSRTTCPSKELRDAIMASGMEPGMRETMDLLEDLLAALRSAGAGGGV